MWRTAALSGILVGCGAAASTTETAQNTEPVVVAPTEVVARLGCDEVTNEQLDRFIADEPALRLMDEVSRDEALAFLLRHLVVKRLARELHVQVEEVTVDESIVELAEGLGMTVEELYLESEAQNVDAMGYRAIVREHILSLRVANILWGAGFAPPPEPGADPNAAAAVFEHCLLRYVELLQALPTEQTPTGCVELDVVRP